MGAARRPHSATFLVDLINAYYSNNVSNWEQSNDSNSGQVYTKNLVNNHILKVF